MSVKMNPACTYGGSAVKPEKKRGKAEKGGDHQPPATTTQLNRDFIFFPVRFCQVGALGTDTGTAAFGQRLAVGCAIRLALILNLYTGHGTLANDRWLGVLC